MRANPVRQVSYAVALTLSPDEVENLRKALDTACERLNAPVPSADATKRSSYTRATKVLRDLWDLLAVVETELDEAIEHDPST